MSRAMATFEKSQTCYWVTNIDAHMREWCKRNKGRYWRRLRKWKFPLSVAPSASELRIMYDTVNYGGMY